MTTAQSPQKRVLIIDDETGSGDALRVQLQADDIDVVHVASGREAIQRMPELVPDVILLDLLMPDLDGFEVCRILKQSPTYRHIPVILVTALDSVQDRVRGLESGADEFLTKPVSRMELQARVRTMLRIKIQYDELERLLELRQALSYMIVHDLRNPLAAVMLYMQLLKRKGALPPDQVRYLDLAISESQKMSNFLDDMLMLAKMERGKLSLSRSPLFIERIINQVRDKFGPLAEAQGVTLHIATTDQPYPIMGDVTLMQRVVENLVANALKFAPPQTTVTVLVEFPKGKEALPGNGAAAGATPNALVRISVQDQGRGIPPDDMVRMFDQYEAVFMKEHGKSELGLELAFCRMIAEAHGGRIFAGNNPDRGAIITVEI
ncbi:MAG: response regulator [Anaerolineales bacterium]|nr:response regulator [Anaerolineales bacterium]